MGAELAYAIPDIEDSRHTRAKSCSIEQINDHVWRQFCQDEKNDEHLERGCQFANQSGLNLDFSECVVKEDQSQHQQHVPAENQGGQPNWNAREVRIIVKAQHNVTRNQQQFVCQGIQNGSQFTDLIVFSGNEAIDGVAQRCQAE